jgi:lipoprotein-anchoring transpeptidase ErfK/SrfK
MVLLDACAKGAKSAGGARPATTPVTNATSNAAATLPPVTPASSAAVSSSTPAVPAVVLAVNPADGAKAVNPAAPVTVSAQNGSVSTVKLLSSSGATVSGALNDTKSTWTAAAPLGYGRNYTVTATAVNPAGVAATTTATFATLTPENMTQPAINTRAGNTLKSGSTFGVGMVIRVHFDEEITNKAAAEKALVVTTTPAVVGGWFWLDNQNVLWRPQNYYPKGTKVTVSANVYGVQVGDGLYGQSDVSASFVIGRKNVSIADDKTHQVQVFWDDVLQRTMPTSMGKGGFTTGSHGEKISFFTPSGTYTVLDWNNPVLMDSSSYGLPVNAPGGYKEYIAYATRISTDGIYLHQLDSTVWAQGHRNTSHGCLNLNKTNAVWYYQNAQIGDVVTVKNTGGPALAQWQNGDWSLSWAQWQAGSALK